MGVHSTKWGTFVCVSTYQDIVLLQPQAGGGVLHLVLPGGGE